MTSSATPHDPSTETVEPLPETAVVQRRPSPAVEWVEVDGEVVAWNGETEDLHLLDPIASLIFQLCDGTAELRENTADLAEAFGQPVALISRDVAECLTNLRSLGLVEVVG